MVKEILSEIDFEKKVKFLTTIVWGLMFLLVILGSNFIFSNIEKVVKVEEVFYASVFVPDFKRGENPLVDYENTKYLPFKAVYRVEVKNTKGSVVCVGSNINRGMTDYTPDDILDPYKTTFSWFVDTLIDPIAVRGRKCHEVLAELPPQEYYITWSFDITLDDGFRLPLYRPERSNTFRTE